MKIGISALMAAALLAASPANAACWTETAYQAAQIRDFETKMMVSMLRCRLVGNDFTESYNRFVRSKREVLQGASAELQAEFAKSVGKGRALNAYDDYMTKVANGYGGGADGLSCREASFMTDAAAKGETSRSELLALAEKSGSQPRVPGGRCGVTFALKDK